MSSARHPTGTPIQKIYADRYARKKGCGKISAPPPQNNKPMNPTMSDRLCKRSHRVSDTSPFMACSRTVDVDLSGRRRGWHPGSVAAREYKPRSPSGHQGGPVAHNPASRRSRSSSHRKNSLPAPGATDRCEMKPERDSRAAQSFPVQCQADHDRVNNKCCSAPVPALTVQGSSRRETCRLVYRLPSPCISVGRCANELWPRCLPRAVVRLGHLRKRCCEPAARIWVDRPSFADSQQGVTSQASQKHTLFLSAPFAKEM